jgi:uridine phosphorylase
MTTATVQSVGITAGVNSIPLGDDGRAYHFGCRKGEVSNAILLVSDYALAQRFSANFDTLEFSWVSNRGYTTYTGTYKGARLSIVAFGIGFAMVDFLLHEVRAVVDGPLTFIQIGTAASPSNLPLGTAVIVRDAVAYEADFDNFTAENSCPYRIFAKPVSAASAVVAAIEAGLRFIQVPFEIGRVASGSSFTAGIAAYPPPEGFDYKTGELLQRIVEKCGEIASLEMDTYPLLWMSARATREPIWSGAVSLVGSNLKGDVLPPEEILKRLDAVGTVMLAQLAALQGAR